MKRNLLVTAIGAALIIGSASVAYADDPPAPKTTTTTVSSTTMTQDESPQMGTDAWITKTVKSNLMKTDGISSADISVTTTNGLVTLSGVLDNNAQVQKSIAVAQAVKGVNKVDSSTLTIRD